MSFTVANSCWLSLTVSLSAIELLYVSHCLLWLLHWLSTTFSPVQWSFYMSLIVSYMVAGCLTLSLWSHGVAE